MAKEPESDDPMELIGTAIPGGDPAIMARCLIEEFAMMGFDRAAILELFRRPAYKTHRLYVEHGEQWVRGLIEEVLASAARIRVSVKHFHHLER